MFVFIVKISQDVAEVWSGTLCLTLAQSQQHGRRHTWRQFLKRAPGETLGPMDQ